MTYRKGQYRVSGEDSTSSATSSPATGAESPGPGAPAGRGAVLGEIRQQRIDKVHQLREQGIDPYPPDAVDRGQHRARPRDGRR